LIKSDDMRRDEGRRSLKIRWQIMTIEALRTLKQFYTYRDLSSALKIPEALLCRYVTGDVAPSMERAMEIALKLHETGLIEKMIERKLEIDEMGVVNIYPLAYDSRILKLAAYHAFTEFSGSNVNAVLTAAVNGIPLATMVSSILDAKLAVAKKNRDPSTKSYLEIQYLTLSPPTLTSLYLPSTILKPGDNVLIVDDLLQSGRTLHALSKLAEQAGGRIIGVYALLALGDAWRASVPETIDKIVIAKHVRLG